MDDRRRHPREPCLISAHVRIGKRIYEGTIVDLCEDGCFLATTAPIDEDSAVQLRFRHPRTDAMAKARAVVARRVRPGQGRMGLGLRLVDTLTALEPGAAGTLMSASGTWSREELATRSGTWSAYDLHQSQSLAGETPSLHDRPGGERRGVHTEDSGRAYAGRRRVRIQVAGGGPAMALMLNMSEGGLCAACERPPPEGKLFRLDLDWDDRTVSLTAKCVYRATIPGGLRAFGASILQFAGHDARTTWHAILADLRE